MKSNAIFSLDIDLIHSLKSASLKADVPMSAIVNRLLADAFESGESDAVIAKLAAKRAEKAQGPLLVGSEKTAYAGVGVDWQHMMAIRAKTMQGQKVLWRALNGLMQRGLVECQIPEGSYRINGIPVVSHWRRK